MQIVLISVYWLQKKKVSKRNLKLKRKKTFLSSLILSFLLLSKMLIYCIFVKLPMKFISLLCNFKQFHCSCHCSLYLLKTPNLWSSDAFMGYWKRTATWKWLRILDFFAKDIISQPAIIIMFKVNSRNTRTRCEICSKLAIKIASF